MHVELIKESKPTVLNNDLVYHISYWVKVNFSFTGATKKFQMYEEAKSYYDAILKNGVLEEKQEIMESTTL